MTEKDCLEYCKLKEYDWGGLYEHLDRVSCWCCRNKNLKEIKQLKEYFPQYYERLKELEREIGENMKPPHSLEDRFEN